MTIEIKPPMRVVASEHLTGHSRGVRVGDVITVSAALAFRLGMGDHIEVLDLTPYQSVPGHANIQSAKERLRDANN